MRAILLGLAFLLVSSFSAAKATVYISNDRGGKIGTYTEMYRQLNDTGELVVINGLCASACTIVLGAIPPTRICITPRAVFGFHAAWEYDSNGKRENNLLATQMLFGMYPAEIQKWISRHGGLTSTLMLLKVPELTKFYPLCINKIEATAQ